MIIALVHLEGALERQILFRSGSYRPREFCNAGEHLLKEKILNNSEEKRWCFIEQIEAAFFIAIQDTILAPLPLQPGKVS